MDQICKEWPLPGAHDREDVPCSTYLDRDDEDAQSIGIDRWPIDLSHKYGMRDGYACPVGGRWVVGFWSPRRLDHNFTQQARGLLYMAASAAAVRLERLILKTAVHRQPRLSSEPDCNLVVW